MVDGLRIKCLRDRSAGYLPDRQDKLWPLIIPEWPGAEIKLSASDSDSAQLAVEFLFAMANQ